MDKIFFWKHKEKPLETPHELGLGKEHDLGLGLKEEPLPPMPGQPSTPGVPPPSPPPSATSAFAQPQQSIDKDIQLLSAKLDSLKAILDNINQRLANIERIAQESQQHEGF